jgi:hypothetical protein
MLKQRRFDALRRRATTAFAPCGPASKTKCPFGSQSPDARGWALRRAQGKLGIGRARGCGRHFCSHAPTAPAIGHGGGRMGARSRSQLGRMWGRSFRVGASELVLEEGPGISQTFRPERQFWGVLRHVPCDRIWPEAIPRGFRLARRFDGRLSCHGPSPLRLVSQGRLRAVVGFIHKSGKRDIDSVFFCEVGHRSTPHKRVGNCYRKVVRDRVFFRSCAQHANQFRYRQTHG